MPFYMFQGRYSTGALKAMVESPQNRETAARALVEAVGGKLHQFYFTFGSDDVVAIIEAPDDKSVAACSFALGASGALSGGATTKLMTAAEGMAAMEAAQTAAKNYKPATG
ncbi:MAG: GYD domain-containing protein [Hyphomicrobiaceae bacterium]